MQSFNYVNVGDGLPLAPIITIKVASPDWLDKTGEYSIEAFLDTGSDCTLIPLEIISSLELSIVDSYVEITGIAGGRDRSIETESEYQRVLMIVEMLMNKKDISAEEDRLLDLFVILVEKFESEHYPSPKRSTPHSRLLHLMEANNLRSVDLISVFGSSDLAAEVVEGKHSIDKTHVEKLSDRFSLPANIFLI